MSSDNMEQAADINFQDSPLMMGLETSNDEAFIRNLLEAGADVNMVDSQGRTPLLRYLQREDSSVGIVEALLDFNADVNGMDVDGESPLVTAIRNSNNEAVIRVLVERGAEVNGLTYSNFTPLLVLLREGKHCSVDTVKLLLAKGAGIHCVDKCGCSPLMIALKNSRVDTVIEALLEAGTNVNMASSKCFCKEETTPLLLYLKQRDCSIDIVKLLLLYNADVNAIDPSGNSVLSVALENGCDEQIIRALVEKGAGLNTLNRTKKSPLCIAFRFSSSDVVKLLLDAGSSPNACMHHQTALHCATDFSCSGLTKDILKVLLKVQEGTNIDLNKDYRCGCTLMCFALVRGAKPHDIQLLLDAGASLNACKNHFSSLGCVTSGLGAPLREDVVQLLLRYGASVDDRAFEVLKRSLRYSNYETGAIKLLLDLPGVDASYVTAKEGGKTLLHIALENPNCKLDVVQLLVSRKEGVHKPDHFLETPLHSAVKNNSCDLRIITYLLQNGSPVNAKNRYDSTPLMLAVRGQQSVGVIKELLMFGADVGKDKFCHAHFRINCELLEFIAREYDDCRNPETKQSYFILLKFFLLQNPDRNLEIENWRDLIMSYKLKHFTNACLNEVEKMDLLQVGHGHTFRVFVSRYCLSVEETYDVDQILVCLTKNAFPAYFDVITARIGRSLMEAEVKKLQVYASKILPGLLCGEKVYLNSDILLKISQNLSDEDLLKFILAFYKSVNQSNSGEVSKDDSVPGKRYSEPSFKLHKLPRL